MSRRRLQPCLPVACHFSVILTTRELQPHGKPLGFAPLDRKLARPLRLHCLAVPVFELLVIHIPLSSEALPITTEDLFMSRRW